MNLTGEICEQWLGLCPKSPAMHATAAVAISRQELVHSPAPEGSGPGGKPGRIRHGISIAAASLKAIVRDRQMLWFTLLSGLVMLFLILVMGWSHRYIDPAFPFTVLIGGMSFSVDLQYLWVAIPFGDSNVIFYFGLFLTEMVCLSGFIVVLAGLIRYRSGGRTTAGATAREAWVEVRASLRPLAALSGGMALAATLVYTLISQSLFFGGLVNTVAMALFWLPYSYYEPQNWNLGAVYYSAYFFSLEIMAINALLFLASLYLVPSIVLEKKGLIPALFGSATLFRRTWRELLGCLLFFGAIILGVAAIGLVIGQSPALLSHDYDFFLSASRGYLPMMMVCYGFILASWILMAAGFSAGGVVIADLYHIGKGDGISVTAVGSLIKQEPGS